MAEDGPENISAVCAEFTGSFPNSGIDYKCLSLKFQHKFG